jgi:hypothetical protein
MSNVIEIIKASRTVRLGSDEVIIRELNWMELRDLVDKMVAEIDKMKQAAKDGGPALTPQLALDMVRNSQELSEYVVLHTTGRDETWMQSLSLSEFMGTLDQALDLNLAVLMGSVKKIRGRLQEVFGGRAAEPMTPTSGK